MEIVVFVRKVGEVTSSRPLSDSALAVWQPTGTVLSGKRYRQEGQDSDGHPRPRSSRSVSTCPLEINKCRSIRLALSQLSGAQDLVRLSIMTKLYSGLYEL